MSGICCVQLYFQSLKKCVKHVTCQWKQLLLGCPHNCLIASCWSCCHTWQEHTHWSDEFLQLQLHAEQPTYCLSTSCAGWNCILRRLSVTLRHDELWLNIHCSSLSKCTSDSKWNLDTPWSSNLSRKRCHLLAGEESTREDSCEIKILTRSCSLKYFGVDGLLWHSLSCLWNKLITVILFPRSHIDSHPLRHVRKLQMEMKREGE